MRKERRSGGRAWGGTFFGYHVDDAYLFGVVEFVRDGRLPTVVPSAT